MKLYMVLVLLWICSQSGYIQGASLPIPLPMNEEETADYGGQNETALAETQPPDELLQNDNESSSLEFGDEILLSDLVENMDAASLMVLIGKLKEEYVAKAGEKNAERVRNSFDTLLTTLLDLASVPELRVVSNPTELLDMLSEEEPDDDEMYTDYYEYSDEEEEDDDDDDEPSLLDFQAWNRGATEEDIDDNI